MKLHSPFQTVMQRRVVPALMTVTGGGILVSLLMSPAAPARVIAVAAVILIIVGLVYGRTYYVMAFPVADSVVYDNGVLRVRHHGREAAVPVSSITGMRGRFGLNPETITLDFFGPTPVGSSITFIPPARIPSLKEHPMMAKLREMMRA